MKVIKIIFSVVILVSICISCKTRNTWNLVWSEEFNYNGMPDLKVWNYDTMGNAWGWGNNELQCYTSNNPKNSIVENGILKINAIHDVVGGKRYSSARLITKTK